MIGTIRTERPVPAGSGTGFLRCFDVSDQSRPSAPSLSTENRAEYRVQADDLTTFWKIRGHKSQPGREVNPKGKCGKRREPQTT